MHHKRLHNGSIVHRADNHHQNVHQVINQSLSNINLNELNYKSLQPHSKKKNHIKNTRVDCVFNTEEQFKLHCLH